MQEEKREKAKCHTPRRFKLTTVATVVRASGLVPTAVAFVVLFFLAAFAVHATEPSVVSFHDALWLCFQVVTTIGLGDFTSATAVGRIAIVVLSVYSVFFLALMTGAVVSYCSEAMRQERNEKAAELREELDRLPDMSREELVEFADRAKDVFPRVRR